MKPKQPAEPCCRYPRSFVSVDRSSLLSARTSRWHSMSSGIQSERFTSEMPQLTSRTILNLLMRAWGVKSFYC